MSIKNLSVFFPLYNEEGNVRASVSKAIRVLEDLKIEYEILLINDGSKDQTGKIADSLAKENSKIRVIHHPKNLGYGEALKSGFYNAKNEVIVYTDGDGQFDFSEIHKFLEKIADNDLVLGYRIKRQDPFFRILFKKGWKLSLLLFFGLVFKDVDCGFKMIRKNVLEKIAHLESTRGAMINAELAIKTKKGGFRIAQVGVNHYPRLSGKPTGASLSVIIRSYLDLLKLWWKLKDQKILFLILMAILGLAAFLRFYKIDQYMTFLGDEGRDAIIVKNILSGQNFPLLGPPTSVGNIYLGPLYYYMMAGSMAIFYLDPVAAAGMNALLGVASVGLIYYLGKVWFGRTAGLLASYLYAISPVTIIYSKSSWNPNPAPFFALIGIFSLYQMHKSGNFLWLSLTGAALVTALQMHYLALILIPITAVLWTFELLHRFSKGLKIKNLISGTFLGMMTFLILMSPLLIFDLKHQFLNYRAITTLINDGSTIRADLWGNFVRIPKTYSYNLVGRYISAENFYLGSIVSLLILLGLFRKGWSFLALGVWLGIGLLGVSFYRQKIFDHYLGFLNPAPFLLLGSLSSIKFVSRKIVIGFLLILLTLLTIVNYQKNPLLKPPNNQLKRTQDIAKFIISKSGGKELNFALISENNYDAAYQYYLDVYGNKPKNISFDLTEQLFVVCEDPICNVINNSKFEIAAFGWGKIESEYDMYGLKIYRLVHNPTGRPY